MRSALLLLAAALALAPAWAQAPQSPAAHRLMITPTARPVPSGDVRLGVTQFVIPTGAVGLGRGVSVGAGVVVLPNRNAAGVVLVEPKWSLVDRDGLAVAVGVTGQARLFYEPEATALPFAVVTVGGRDVGAVAGTVGLGARVNVRRAPGVLFYDASPLASVVGDIGAGERTAYLVQAPVVWLGLEARASRRVTLLVEAAALPSQNLRFDFSRDDIFRDDCCTGRVGTGITRGTVYYDITAGAAARVQTGPVALDLGLVLGQDRDGYADAVPAVAPWLTATVGL